MSESWLVDTFAIIGYDLALLPRSILTASDLAVDGRIHERPKILFRYPAVPVSSDSEEYSTGQVDHVANIIDFCQPLGWCAHKQPKLPQFHMVVLTDTPGCRLFAAIFNMYEGVPIPKRDDNLVNNEEEEPETSSLKSWLSSGTGTPGRKVIANNNLLPGELSLRRDSKSSLRSGGSSVAHEKPPPEPKFIYIPKSILLISKFNYPEIFRSCLNVIYRVHLEQNARFPVETVIANLSSVLVPPPSHPPVTFGLGIGPRLTIRQPTYQTVPVTGSTVQQLFHYLGVHNTLTAVCCLLNEFKVVVHSSSLNHLTQSCHALVSLLYPLPFYHVYIPVLPESVIAMLSAPTPFLIGIHSSLRHEALSQPDVVVVDLDAGSVRLAESVRLLQLGEVYNRRILKDLMYVLNPELFVADSAFVLPNANSTNLWQSTSTTERVHSSFPDTTSSALLSSANAAFTDKLLRACFLRLFASLFAGYRHSLSAIRICPEPHIVFDKAHFVGQRGEAFTPTETLSCYLLKSFFPQFLQDRMIPFRETDIFDEICASISATLAEEEANPDKIFENIRFVAHQLLQNENIPTSAMASSLNSNGNELEALAATLASTPQPYPKFSVSDNIVQIDRLASETREKLLLAASTALKQSELPVSSKKRKVVMGNVTTIDSSMPPSFLRRLEVVRSCVAHIFNNRVAEARRLLPATMRALKLVEVRRRFPTELARFAYSESEDTQRIVIAPVLNNHQFDLLVQLVVFALSLESHWDENGIAAAVLPLSTIFYRYLGDSRHQQFLYTAIQDHPLWRNPAFWTSVIYRHIAAAVAAVHGSTKSSYSDPNVALEPPLSLEMCGEYLEKEYQESSAINGHSNAITISNGTPVSEEDVVAKKETLCREEESMAYSYCKHFANVMVYLLTPLDPSRDLSGLLNSGVGHGDFAATSSQCYTDNAAGHADSSIYSESGFDEQDLRDVKGVVHWFINHVLQDVCNDAGVSEDHRRNLEAMLGETVGSHMDYLEMVYQHTRHLPPLQKPRILEPTLLAGEQKLIGPLRAIILPDGRRLGVSGETWIGQAPSGSGKVTALGGGGGAGGGRRLAQSGATSDITSVSACIGHSEVDDSGNSDHAVCLLPAEGAVFLTTYRLVFIGNPIDAYASEVVVTRSIPVASLWSEKQMPSVYLHHPYDHYFTQCYQMRSNTLEIMKILFDSTEVNEASIVELRQQLSSLRWPLEVTSFFCARQLLSGSGRMSSVPDATMPTSITMTPLDSRKHHSSQRSKSKLKTLAKSTLSKLNVGANVQLSLERKIVRTNALIQRQIFSGGNTIRASQRSSTHQPAIPSAAGSSKFVCNDRAEMLMQDFDRLKLGSVTSRPGLASTHGDGWRLSYVNRQFSICRSYPEVISTRMSVSDEVLKRIAQSCRMSRFPAAVWRHSENGAVLIRSAAFAAQSNRVITAIRRTANDASTSNEAVTTSSSSLATDLLIYISSMTQSHAMTANDGTVRRPIATDLESSAGTPSTVRRSHALSSASNPSANSNVSVCIVGDATQLRALRSVVQDPAVDFISVQVTSITSVKAAYKRLVQKALCPADAGERRKRDVFNSAATTSTTTFHTSLGQGGMYSTMSDGYSSSISGEGFFKAFNDSGWLQQVSTLLRVSSMMAMLIDRASISVIMAAEDGSDFVTQVTSLTQLLLDPYYRTRAGFKALITREWLAFGHRFGVRGSQLATNRLSSYIPIFLQFLDAVHQLIEQFPVAFEFNNFFIKTMAYHSTSNRFFDWLLDSDPDRLASGLPIINGTSEEEKSAGCSFFWDFVDKQWETSPVYFNFFYDPERSQSIVLSPKYVLPYLRMWDFFHGHPLATDMTYDAIVPFGGQPRNMLSDSSSALGRHESAVPVLVDAAFEPPELALSNGLIASLKAFCDAIEITNGTDDNSQFSCHDMTWQEAMKAFSVDKIKPVGEALLFILHPRIPVPASRQMFNWTASQGAPGTLLEVARSLGSMSLSQLAISFGRGIGNQPHVLRQVSSVSKAGICGACSAMLWPPTPAVVCDRCSLVAHRQCQARVTKMHQCPGATATNEDQTTGPHPASPPQVIMYRSDMIASSHNTPTHSAQRDSPSRSAGTMPSSGPGGLPSRFMMSGSLYKRGQLLHGLTRRFYVLDLASQRIVYYESQSEAEISSGVSGAEKGAIMLTQIVDVVSLDSQQPSSLDTSEPVEYGFTIVTTKRNHHFLTSSHKEADKWIEAIMKALTLL